MITITTRHQRSAPWRVIETSTRWAVVRGYDGAGKLDVAGDFATYEAADEVADKLNTRRRVLVSVGDRWYFVNLDTEEVHARVHRDFAWREVRVTSKRIETSAILRASDQWHANNPGVHFE